RRPAGAAQGVLGAAECVSIAAPGSGLDGGIDAIVSRSHREAGYTRRREPIGMTSVTIKGAMRRRRAGLRRAAFRLGLALLALAALRLAARAADPAASPWFETDQGRVRLVAAATGTGSGERVRLGLHFVLAPGWKIYWRAPGDAGLPPSLAWEGSRNLAAAE